MISLISQIEAQLDKVSDGNLFEKVACALLQKVYPRLVPIPGGSDSGFDGAISVDKEQVALVCTVGADPKRNLKESLQRLSSRPEWSGKAVFATPRKLSAPARMELFDEAKRQSAVLLQVHEQSDFAARLYRDSELCYQLLGLESSLTALTEISLHSRRTRLPLLLSGRAQDQAWLTGLEGDGVVLAQPGGGKTYFLEQAVKNGWRGRFVRSSAQDKEIVDGLRELELPSPRWMIVDDAYFDQGKLLDRLCTIRASFQEPFHILATGWNSAEDALRGQLTPAAMVRTLEPLTRQEIKSLFDELGLSLNNAQLRSLITQAGGKPGLAVTLGTALLRGEYEEVFRGEAIRREVVALVGTGESHVVRQMLGVMSLSGRKGIDIASVADFLKVSMAEVRSGVALLEDAGVVEEASNIIDGSPRIRVVPPEARGPLVFHTFFGGADRLDANQWLASAGLTEASFHALARAYLYRANQVPATVPFDAAQKIGTDSVLQDCSFLSEELFGQVFETYPDRPETWLRAGLTLTAHAPGTLQRLFSLLGPASENSQEQWISTLESWIGELGSDHTQNNSLERRKILADALQTSTNGALSLALRARLACLALEPGLQGVESEPAGGLSISITRSCLDQAGLRHLEEVLALLTDTLRLVLADGSPEDFSRFSHLVWKFAHPSSLLIPRANETLQSAYHQFARRLLAVGEPFGELRLGVRAGLAEAARWVGFDPPLVNGDFHLLFCSSSENSDDPVEAMELRSSAIEALARRLVADGPKSSLQKLAHWSSESLWVANKAWPSGIELVAASIATISEDRDAWFAEILRHNNLGGAVSGFLGVFSDDKELQVDPNLLFSALQSGEFRSEALWQLLVFSASLTERIEDQLLLVANDSSRTVQARVRGGRVPQQRLARLLAPSSCCRLAAAAGLSESEHKNLSKALRRRWRQVVVAETPADPDRWWEFALRERLLQEPELAFAWLCRLLAEEDDFFAGGFIIDVLAGLDQQQRCDLLTRLPTQPPRNLVGGLVGDDPELFEFVLDRNSLVGEAALEPLGREIDGTWSQFARQALGSGRSEDTVATGTVSFPGSFGSDDLQRRLTALEELEHDPHLEEVVSLARGRLQKRRDRLQSGSLPAGVETYD